ncbi:MAG: transcriptional regulator MraZ [Gammaproteobacteria bacterium]|nr:MAG: transcriptional regulator MraZ [Gammaproteobacteria bacterium]
MFFRGSTNLNLDAKGRLSFPARYRERLAEICDGHLVVTVDLNKDPCLRIYPLPDWQEIEQKVMSAGSTKSMRIIQRFFVGQATECDLDGNGRILVPPTLREYAKLEKKAVLVGQGKGFELWSEEAWIEQNQALMEEDLEIPDVFGDLSL